MPPNARQLILSSNDADAVAKLWYVLPKPPVGQNGWVVYTSDFILEVIQGCWGKSEHVRKTLGWRTVAALCLVAIATLQAILICLSKLPIVSGLMSLAVHFSGRSYGGFFLRSCYWKARLKRLGQNTMFDQGVRISGADRIELGYSCFVSTNVRLWAGPTATPESGIAIGDYSYIGSSSDVGGMGKIEIGDFVAVMAHVGIHSTVAALDHPETSNLLVSTSEMAPGDRRAMVNGDISIEDYAVIGANSLVLPGSRIGGGALVHAYAQVNRQFPAFANIVGPGTARQNGWRRPTELDARLQLDCIPAPTAQTQLHGV